MFSIGPLKRFFLRLANTRPPVLLEPKPWVEAELPQGPSLNVDMGVWRTTRMLEGKEPVVGVAGRTLTEWWGERVGRGTLLIEVETEPLEEVEEALE